MLFCKLFEQTLFYCLCLALVALPGVSVSYDNAAGDTARTARDCRERLLFLIPLYSALPCRIRYCALLYSALLCEQSRVGERKNMKRKQ